MNKVLCSEYSVCVPFIPRIKYCVQSTVFVFHSFHEKKYRVQSRVFVLQSLKEYIIVFRVEFFVPVIP